MKSLVLALFVVVLIVISILIATFGFSTVFKCGALESIPVGDQKCWNVVTGTIDVD